MSMTVILTYQGTVLYCIILYYLVLYRIILSYIVLYYIALYCVVFIVNKKFMYYIIIFFKIDL